MDKAVHKNTTFREVVKMISTIISWTIFVLLFICAIFLAYYFIATKIYAAKGSGYEPKFSLYTIVSGSMIPNINIYDVVIDVKVDNPEDIKINDVITYNSNLPGIPGGTITHRVIAINKDSEGNYYYQTKGDNNLVEDNAIVPFKSVVGKVALRIPQLGKVQKLMATKSGWLIIVLIPSLYILLKSLLKKLKIAGPDGGKFKKFLNRPLLTFNKRKLLTYTPKQEAEEVKVADNFYTYPEDDDEIEVSDLPKLK